MRPSSPVPRMLALAGLAAVAACKSEPGTSAACGFASLAAASLVLQSLDNMALVVADPPANMPEALPARVIGYGTSSVLISHSDAGLALGYEGEGFPSVPGFGLMLVDDSLEVARGVMIYEPEGPGGYPSLGTVTGTASTLPLYGVRVHWPSLNSAKCPLFPTRPAEGT